MAEKQPVTYWDYIRVEDLLSLQEGVERDESKLENDEVLFITVHQVFELWFKLVLREVRAARDRFLAPRVAEQELSAAVRSLKRVGTILRVANIHWDVMETMPTREFLAFRTKLLPASGFQSAQLRQIEILMGLPEGERLSLGPAGGSGSGYQAALRGPGGSGSPAMERVQRALLDVPTLREAIDAWLWRTPIDGVDPNHPQADQKLSEFVAGFLAAHAHEIDLTAEHAMAIAETDTARAELRRRYAEEQATVRAFFHPSEAEGGARRRRIRAAMLFIETYRELPLLSWPRELLEALVELEQRFVIFRQRHARMVERIIGRRTGTGGSSGVDYLDSTALKYRVFRDLWAIRTLQVRRAAAPALGNAGFYGFRNE
ncbi:MAG: tryptophan 2,3-dioxygenase [Planctomycetes bacterium]|nr:tryptophan 2,3-dioxygenase [Planctomycetota bacterium]